MEIKVEQFCSLATSPSWQAWLYKFNADTYRAFIAKLQNSRGCSQNRDIMKETLAEISAKNGGDDLLRFLSTNYPHMLMKDQITVKSTAQKGQVFEHYNPLALTYPRRKLFTGDLKTIQRDIRSFCLDKIKHDSIIVDGVGYVEYLNRADAKMSSSIPEANWQIAAYRLRSS
jgi:hypothetical protein